MVAEVAVLCFAGECSGRLCSAGVLGEALSSLSMVLLNGNPSRRRESKCHMSQSQDVPSSKDLFEYSRRGKSTSPVPHGFFSCDVG